MGLLASLDVTHSDSNVIGLTITIVLTVRSAEKPAIKALND